MKWYLALLALVLVAGLVAWTMSRSRESAAPTQPIPTPNVASVPNQVAPPIPLAPASEPAVEPSALEPASRESVDAPTIRGRVVEKGTSTPVAGVALTLRKINKALAETKSDARGRFEFSHPRTLALSIEVTPPDGWRIENPHIRVNKDAAPDEIIVELERSLGHVLRGRVVDSDTGELVPEYWLELGSSTWASERVRSDAEGRFVSTHKFEPGSIAVELTDLEHGAQLFGGPRTIGVPNDASEVAIAVDVGPTYSLNLTLPEEARLEDLHGKLERSGWTRWIPENVDAAPVHAGTPPWVRIRRRHDNQASSTAWTLWIYTFDGTWSGHADVVQVRGRVPGVVSIALERSARLDGRVLDAAGRALANANLQVWHHDASGNVDDGSRWSSDASGRFSIPMIQPGAYAIDASDDRHVGVEREFEVLPGQLTSLELVLEDAAIGGEISGVVRSRTGTFDLLTSASLSEIEGEDRYLSETVVWKKNGNGREGSFRFEKVPMGRYRLSLGEPDPFAWDPPEIEVSPPAHDLVFTCLDDVPSAEFRIEVFDEKGNPVSGCALSLSSWEFALMVIDRAYDLGRFPLDAELSWCITAEGFASATGDRSSFDQELPGDPFPKRVARVHLRRGWGTRFCVFAYDTPPLAGARILLDGIETGVTDEQGMLEVFLAKRPQRVDVVHPEFVVDAGEMPADRAVPDPGGLGVTYLVMKRKE